MKPQLAGAHRELTGTIQLKAHNGIATTVTAYEKFGSINDPVSGVNVHTRIHPRRNQQKIELFVLSLEGLTH